MFDGGAGLAQRGVELDLATPALADALPAERVAVSRRRPGVLTVIVERRNPFAHLIDAAPIPESPAEVDLARLDVGDNEYGGRSS